MAKMEIGRWSFLFTDHVGDVYILAVWPNLEPVLRELASVLRPWATAIGLPDVPVHLWVDEMPDLPDWSEASVAVVTNCGKVTFDLALMDQHAVGMEVGFSGSTYDLLFRTMTQPCVCKQCRAPNVPEHSDGFHSLLHELVHVKYPQLEFDNDWADRRVVTLLIAPPLGCRIVQPSTNG